MTPVVAIQSLSDSSIAGANDLISKETHLVHKRECQGTAVELLNLMLGTEKNNHVSACDQGKHLTAHA